MKTPAEPNQSLRIAVDIGGTFTDGVATLVPSGRIWVGKTPTTPADPGEAVSTVVGDLLDQVRRSVGEGATLSEVVHGTTLITNTLIERKGVRTALVATRGMADVLAIGRERRYDIYDLDIVLPEPLVPASLRLEVDERIGAQGEVLKPLDDTEVQAIAQTLRGLGAESVAVSLMHSYVNKQHEKAIEEQLSTLLPGVAVSVSCELAQEINEFERTSTTVANAYVKPIVARYLQELEARIAAIGPGIPLRVMVSSGGFTSALAGAAAPIQLLESGPAAGVLSALNSAQLHGIDRVLAFDMGGTTAKACVAVGGEPPIEHSFECARVERFKRGSGLPILIPSIELIEIGAGGGSIAYLNRLGLLNIGPESSGSVPGPACYGRGGTDATVTDADLLLGYLAAGNFLGGEMQLRTDLASAAVERLAARLGMPAAEVAWGIYNLVNENMASAARIHIAENAHDARTFTMVATGGAGPVHAVEVARKLRVPRVVIPIAAGAGSCLGMLAAPARVDRSWSQPQLLADVSWPGVASRIELLRREAERELASAGASDVEWQVGAEIRYEGQGSTLGVTTAYGDVGPELGRALVARFEAQYTALYGRLVPGGRLQVITWRLTGKAPARAHRFEWGDGRAGSSPKAAGRRPIYLPLKRDFGTVPVYDRYGLAPSTVLEGPLILEERESTVVVPVGAQVEILSDRSVSIVIKEFE